MREIKFRAWDGKQMIYRGIHDRNWYSEDLGGKVVKIAHPNDKRLLSIMQFTGLLDKNGKEIYEGDILSKGKISKRPSWKKGHDYYCVSFSNGGFVANGYNGEFEVSPILHNLNRGCEIIGNIHENPELLNN